jgi:transcriptional regulator with GAF, ATPase, and Fis domain
LLNFTKKKDCIIFSVYSVFAFVHDIVKLEFRISSLKDMTPSEAEYQHQIAALQKRLQLQELMTDISAMFVNLPASAVDGQIEQGLKRIVEFLGIDRSSFGEFSEDMKDIGVTHSFAVPGIDPLAKVVMTDLLPWYASTLSRAEIIKIEHPAELPEEAVTEKDYFQKTGLKSNLVIPVAIGGVMVCGIAFGALRTYHKWPEDLVEQLKRIAEIFGQAIYRKREEEELRRSYAEIKQLKDRLQAEAEYLHSEIEVNHRYGDIIGESAVIRQVLNRVEQVAPTNSSVLISGETGAGKELIAHAIHGLSLRHEHVMVKVNCATLPPPLIENELFGREKGAYTGAMARQIGRFEVADGSTIFLDEIGELSLEVQSKLLRVLQDGEFERLGSSHTIKVDVRVIAATNRDLAKEVDKGRFRDDLFYRLNVFPSRRRLCANGRDIPLLVWAFIKEFSVRMGKKIQLVPKKTMEALQHYRWPGNIRQLRIVIEHAMIISAGKTLQVQLPEPPASLMPEAGTLEEVEIKHITQVLEKTSWRIKGRGGAAELLGLNPGTLYSRMQKLGIPHRRQKIEISTIS